MKTILLLSLLAVGLQQLDGFLDHLNAWVELGIKFAGLTAIMGGAWKWAVGPGWRRIRAAVLWVTEQLRLIGRLDDRLEAMETELHRGHEHFERLDQALEAMTSEHAQEVRAAIHQDREVRLTPDGHAERRDRYGDISGP